MSDPAAARPTKGWPFLAISLLILLLGGFLYLKWRKKDSGPEIVKEPPHAVEPVGAQPPKAADPVRTGPAGEAPPAGEPEFDLRIRELRKSLDGRKWDEAARALEAARKLRPEAPELKGFDETIAEGRKKDEADRREAALKAELRNKQERAWAVLKEQIEKDRITIKDTWDAWLASLEAFAKEYPNAGRDEDYAKTLKSIQGFQAEADKFFKKDLAEAQKHFAEGHYLQAISTAENALKYYPERHSLVKEFQDRARELLFEKSMVRIPSTSCWIGADQRPEEKPLRQVKLPAFMIDRYEVTNEEYFAFTSATGHDAPPFWGGRKPPKDKERHPVVYVTWDDAQDYAKWAGKRLPTAEEWEVAARGPDKREFPWGNVFLEKEDKFPCNCLEYWQFNKTRAPGTTPVDSMDKDNGESAFGVYGMGGNVWEWTSTAAPAKGSKPPPEFRILKGGSFMTPQRAIRCANVYPEDPRLAHPDVGFRCARDVK